MKKLKPQNANSINLTRAYKRYRRQLIIRFIFLIVFTAMTVAFAIVFPIAHVDNTILTKMDVSVANNMKYLFTYMWALPLLGLIILLPIDIVERNMRAEKILFSKCDVLTYTLLKSKIYDSFSSIGNMNKRMKTTLRIDFFSGNYIRVCDTPKMISLVKLHTMPEFLMYYAFASYIKDDLNGVDTANTYITDHQYYHKNHKKPIIMYQVAFAVTRFAACMMDSNYEGAAYVFTGINVPKSYRALDSLVRFCRARAEEAQGHIKAARGLYANVGRNSNDMYLGKNAEFLRTQLLNVAESTQIHAKHLESEAEIKEQKKKQEQARIDAKLARDRAAAMNAGKTEKTADENNERKTEAQTIEISGSNFEISDADKKGLQTEQDLEDIAINNNDDNIEN